MIRFYDEIIYSKGGEILAQAARRSCGCIITGDVQVQTGWGPGHPHPVSGNPAHGKGLDFCKLKDPSTSSCSYDSVTDFDVLSISALLLFLCPFFC